MYKDFRYINAGENEIYRYGRKAVERVSAFLEPNENGYYNFPVDGGKYWSIGTSEGKYGEFCKFENTFFSVNRAGCAYAKVGTDKAEKFVEFLNAIISEMHRLNSERVSRSEVEEDE